MEHRKLTLPLRPWKIVSPLDAVNGLLTSTVSPGEIYSAALHISLSVDMNLELELL